MSQFRKNISTFSLMMTGITAILGSGWLLGTQKIANVAGPAGILSWIFGAFVALLVALFFVEIGSAYPSSGGIGYYSHITHGRFCGFLTSWVNWLSIVAVPAIEAQSIVQYLSQLSPSWYGFYNVPTHSLTSSGIGFAVLLMLIFTFINYWSVQFFIRFNNVFTMIKIIVPLLTIAALVYNGFHPGNFTEVHDGGFLPFGWKSVFISVVTCGVVMSFNGFQSPLTFSEEIASPKKMLPIAVVSSILIALLLYVLLQIVFVGSLTPAMLSQGWAHVNFRSPYVELLMLANLHVMVMIVYMGSVVSPGVCGAAFIASASRIMVSLSREKHLPRFLSVLDPVHGNPRYAILTCLLIGSVFLFLFRGWYHLVAVISVIHLFSYLPAPVIVMANRLKNKMTLKQKKEQFVLPLAHVLAPFLLFVLSVLLFYAGWPLIPQILILTIPGILLFLYYETKLKVIGKKDFGIALKGASWLIFHFIGLCAIVFFADAHHAFSTKESMVALAILTLVTYVYGAFFAWDKRQYASQHRPKDDMLSGVE